MTPYLVKGTIEACLYMQIETRKFEDIRIVFADSPEEAKDKFDDFWECKSASYDVTYFSDSQVMETIL